MWSETNPIGTSTTDPASILRRWSHTSGSSHGTCGGPLRDCHTRSHGWSRPSARLTSSALLRSCASYSPPDGPAVSAIETGMLWAVKTSRASSRPSRSSAARVRSAIAATNPGCSP